MRKFAGAAGLFFILTMLFPTSAATGDVPQTILYQGRLTNMSGRPLIDSTVVTFTIYNTAVGGEMIWTETHDLKPDDFGLFTVELGSILPLDGSIIDGQKLYLGIMIESSTEMSPRQLLTSVPYAVNAGIAQTLNSTTRLKPSIIEGTAATLFGNQTFIGQNEFLGRLKITSGDILVSDSLTANVGALIHVERVTSNSNDLWGVYAKVSTTSLGELIGIRGLAERTSSQAGRDVFGVSGTAVSVETNRFGLWGKARSSIGATNSGESYGVYGSAQDGVTAYGIFGAAQGAITNWAGYFAGDVRVTGTITEGAGRIQIDHPLDPENKYLIHNQVASPDMMTIYNGNVILDNAGWATVLLPDYFDSLNNNYRYQLTSIGGPAPNLHIARTIANGAFKIAGGTPGMQVSWMVTGIRQDAYARAHLSPNVIEKPTIEQGRLLHPEAFGQPIEMGLNFNDRNTVTDGNLR